jgi:polyisoprenoid-binding protein YceI
LTATTVAPALIEYTGTWNLDTAHTRLGFRAKHAMVATVRGQFNDFSGTLVLDGAEPTRSAANVEIEAASFSSGSADRDNHVKSPDFLDVENFPTLNFTSTEVRVEGGQFVLVGDLTIRGTTRRVEIDVEPTGVSVDPFGSTRAGFEGTTTISRKDFGLTWNVALEAGGVLVSDKIRIDLDISAVKA